MKYLILAGALMAMGVQAEEETSTWDKTKGTINTTAEKIDSGTREVIKKTKARIRQEQQKREDREKRKREDERN